MSAAGVARGPLQLILGSSSGQWLALGAGAVVFFPEKVDLLLGTSFRHGLASFSAATVNRAADVVTSAPIVIHTSGAANNNARNGIVVTLVTYGVGAGAVWVAFMVASNILPDWAKEMLPVSRQLFNKAVTNLGKGIIGVKDALSKQIMVLMNKQDALAKQQSDTHDEVLHLSSSLGDARRDLASLGESLGRCEDQLESAERLQLYTSRGVKLLVRCVANMLPSNDRIMSELLEFTKEGEQLRNNNKNPGALGPPAGPSPAQQEIYRLTATSPQAGHPTFSQAQPQYHQAPPRGKPMAESSPENELPVTPGASSRETSTGSVDSYENIEELFQLVREGKIQTNLVRAT